MTFEYEMLASIGHSLLGTLTMLLFWAGLPAPATAILVYFGFYEWMQERRIHDKAFIAIAEFLGGLVVVSIGWLIWRGV